jgi:hypothetical protein
MITQKQETPITEIYLMPKLDEEIMMFILQRNNYLLQYSSEFLQ